MASEDGPPHVQVDVLTDEQVAMLNLLGNPAEVAPRGRVDLFEPTPPELLSAAPGISPNVIREYLCPVVEVLGRPRMIRPNGDLSSVG